MLKALDLRDERASLDLVLPRPIDAGANVREPVSRIIEQVRDQGDSALLALTAQFDGVSLSTTRVSSEEIAQARAGISSELLAALKLAWSRILEYHGAGHEESPAVEGDGIRVDHRSVPVDRAGIYAPGGLARYPSSVLMGAAPAVVAGVAELVLCVPPGPDGRIDDASLAAASIAGIGEVHAIGGAQAIAAMALGTQSIRRVDVIAGPGNAYVAEAKRQLSGTVGIAAGFAGPSEIAIVADNSADPRLVAIDLMVQAEHGPDGMAWLISWSQELIDSCISQLEVLVAASPRSEMLRSTFASGGMSCLVRDLAQAMEVSNTVAPEHLELQLEAMGEAVELVRCAGAVFCGPWAPASLGDYAAGPNHILPTNRTARFGSALRADDFRRHIHIVSVSEAGFRALAPSVELLATTEGLNAHADSIRMRFE
ncbi:MAG: histidinol dehydrogenase [Actinobacteria bacterium]|nr:histidinol dehydrogenase [Actinomycetota bacterium]